MAGTKDSEHKRGGAHFAAPGEAPYMSWGDWGDESETSLDSAATSRQEARSEVSEPVQTALDDVPAIAFDDVPVVAFDDVPAVQSAHPSAASPSAASAYVPPEINSDASYAASLDLDDLLDADAPRSTLSSATDSFERIAPGKGAFLTTRDTVSDTSSFARFSFEDEGVSSVRMSDANRPQINSIQEPIRPVRRNVSIAVAVVILALSAFFAHSFITNFFFNDTEGSASVDAAQVLSVDESLEVDGYEYQLSQLETGQYVLMRITSGESLTLAEMSGTAVALVYYYGTFYVPENIDGGWDVVCYTLGDGSVATTYTDEEGNPITGTTALASVSVTEDTLVLTDEAGEQTTLSLS